MNLMVEDVRLPDPTGAQVLVRNIGAGVCHSQLHEMNADRHETFLLGHEACGVIEAAGPDVDLVQPGDAVSVSWVPRHGTIAPQRAGVTLSNGEYASTDEMVFTWATHSLIDQRYTVSIPQVLAGDSAAVLGCAVLTGASAVTQSVQVHAGATVVVWGAGGVGLSAVAAAKQSRASTIIAVDVSAESLQLARRFGATHVVDATTTEPVRAIHQITSAPHRPPGSDFVFDCVGTQSTLTDGLQSARRGVLGAERGGQLIVVGVPKPDAGVPAREILIGQKTVTASLGVAADTGIEIPRLAQWCVDGEVDLDELVTDRYRLDDINAAVSDLRSGHVRGRAILTFES